MQTFLPYANFTASASCLDDKRLFKQLIEARQILAARGKTMYKVDGTPYAITHQNHPAVKMWAGYEDALCVYHDAILFEVLCRGFETEIGFLTSVDSASDVEYPDWFGDHDFHASHRSQLYRKDPRFYSQFVSDGYLNMDYIWPKGKE